MERLKWTGAALGLMALAFGLRRWQLDSALNGEGLMDGGAPASVALIAMLVGAAALFLRMALLQDNRVPAEPKGVSGWDLVFGAGDDSVYLGLMVAAAFCTGGAAPLWAAKGLGGRPLSQWLVLGREGYRWVDSGLLEYLLAGLALVSALGLLLSARLAYRMCGTGGGNGWLVLPMLSGGLWLLEIYQRNAPRPSRWLYVPLLLAVVCGVLFHSAGAQLAFERGRPRLMLWLGGMSLPLSAMALADRPGWPAALLLLGQMLSVLAALWTVPDNLARPHRVEWLNKRAALLELRLEQREREAWPEDYEQEEASGDAEIQEDERDV